MSCPTNMATEWQGLMLLPAEVVNPILNEFVPLDYLAKQYPEYVQDLELSQAGLPTSWALQGDESFKYLSTLSYELKSFVMSHLLNANTFVFTNKHSMINFFQGVQTLYGEDVLHNLRKLEYDVDFLNMDSIAGAKLLAEMLAPREIPSKSVARSTEQTETIGGSWYMEAIIQRDLRSLFALPNLEFLHIEFKVNSIHGKTMTIHADVDGANADFLDLIAKLRKVRVQYPSIAGLSKAKVARKTVVKMATNGGSSKKKSPKPVSNWDDYEITSLFGE